MNLRELVPQPKSVEPFSRSREKYVPERPGCYALTTVDHCILYVGLTVNLRARMNAHLDNLTKRQPTKNGRATLFFWIETPDMHKVERTWMNIHLENEGVLPILNVHYSPVNV
jgi:hypothetical protein